MWKTIVASLALACCAFVGLLSSTHDQRQPVDPNTGKVAVMYATTAIKRGEMLEIGRNVDFRLVAESEIAEDAYRKDDHLLQEMKRKAFIAFQPIARGESLRRCIAGNNPAGIIQYELKADPTPRAYSIPIVMDVSAGKRPIEPGVTVDLVFTGRIGSRLKKITRVIVENVRVIAADAEKRAAGQLLDKEPYVMTFPLTSEEIAKVVFAQAHGTITAVPPGTVAKESKTE